MKPAASTMLERLADFLVQPASDFYLPKLLCRNSLDPWFIAELGMAPFRIAGVEVTMTLKDIVCKGLSNMRIKSTEGGPAVQINGNTVAFHSAHPNEDPRYRNPDIVPAQIIMTADAHISINARPMPKGAATITFNAIDDISGAFFVGVGARGNADFPTLTFTSLSVNPALDTRRMSVKLNLESPLTEAINESTLNHVVNESAHLHDILRQINLALNEPDTLNLVSRAATKAAARALKISGTHAATPGDFAIRGLGGAFTLADCPASEGL